MVGAAARPDKRSIAGHNTMPVQPQMTVGSAIHSVFIRGNAAGIVSASPVVVVPAIMVAVSSVGSFSNLDPTSAVATSPTGAPSSVANVTDLHCRRKSLRWVWTYNPSVHNVGLTTYLRSPQIATEHGTTAVCEAGGAMGSAF